MKLEMHIFVCTNERPPEHPSGCCQAKGSEKLIEQLRKEVQRHGLQNKIRVQSCGCLSACRLGPTLVIYPEGTWYCGVNQSDISEIVQSHLLHKVPVERLMIAKRS